jgi:RNA 2',3'-cyclic 3'-phosphodiesterase
VAEAPATGPARRRLFFALWPEPGLQSAVAAAGAQAAAAAGIHGRTVPPERLHLTLLFLGDLDAAGEQRARAVASAVVAPAFDLVLDQAGSFYRSRVLWVGTRHAPPALTALWLALRDGLADPAGRHNRGALAPHVTCLRDIDRPLRVTPIAPLAWPVRGFALVHSQLKKGTDTFSAGDNTEKGDRHLFPGYHVVSHWPLQTAPVPSVKTVQRPGGPE